MKMTFRWYPDAHAVDLDYIRQIPGVTGIVGELPKPVGAVWPLDEILSLKRRVEEHGLALEEMCIRDRSRIFHSSLNGSSR